MDNKPRTILSIDDNEVDGALLQRAVKRTAVPWRLFTLTEGSQALSYLGGEGIYGNREEYPLPDMILLDIRMPKLSGFDVLSWIKERPELRKIPIVALSSSSQANDKQSAEKGGVEGYYVKPSRFQDLQDIVRQINSEHLEKARKPKAAKGKVKSEAAADGVGGDGVGSAASERAAREGVSPEPKLRESVLVERGERVATSV